MVKLLIKLDKSKKDFKKEKNTMDKPSCCFYEIQSGLW